MSNLNIPIDVTSAVFDLIEKSVTLEDLNISKFREKSSLIKEHLTENFDRDKYQKIPFHISKEEIQGLLGSGILEGVKSDDKNDIYIIDNIKITDPLTKLLYALAWKQGDLLKIRQIVNGILSDEDDLKKENSIVFKQFGKYLSRDNQPIVDQHVVRAFVFRKEPTEKNLQFEIANSPTIYQLEYANKYITYVTDLAKSKKHNTRDFYTKVDEILFLLGKFLKEWKV